ncbi:MAG: aspartoacylase [Kangiellaceae bacterium]
MKNNECKKAICDVLLVGGTHGNELTGIHLVNHLKKTHLQKKYPEFNLDFLLANEAARIENRRYIDVDLNRCFKVEDLNNPNLKSKEALLAKDINNKYGPKAGTVGAETSQPKMDFIIDLHTSTANMQTNIVITRIDKFHLQLASFLKEKLSGVTITSEAELLNDHHFLESIAPRGVLIEIGPIAQGCIEHPIMELTQQALLACLDFVDLFNNDQVPVLPKVLNTYSYYSNLTFPTDSSGAISASIHPSLLGKAYPKLKKGTPVFITFDGDAIIYEGESTNLAFINEAAYYDKQIAMCLCEQASYSLETYQRIK